MKRSTESALAMLMLPWGGGMGQSAVTGALESSASKVRTTLPAAETQLSCAREGRGGTGLRGRGPAQEALEGIEDTLPNALTQTKEELWGTDV